MAIRQNIGSEDNIYLQAVPPSTARSIKELLEEGAGPVVLKNFEQAILVLLRRIKHEDLEAIAGAKEGLANKLKQAAFAALQGEGVCGAGQR